MSLMDMFSGGSDAGTQSASGTSMLQDMRPALMQYGMAMLSQAGPSNTPQHPLSAMLANSPALAHALMQAYQRHNMMQLGQNAQNMSQANIGANAAAINGAPGFQVPQTPEAPQYDWTPASPTYGGQS